MTEHLLYEHKPNIEDSRKPDENKEHLKGLNVDVDSVEFLDHRTFLMLQSCENKCSNA
jgi:hypothetical protein